MTAPRVLVAGDVMLDAWINTTRRPDDDEGGRPIFDVTSRRDTLGGAGHVASVVAALGGRPTVLGSVGDDAAGARCHELIEQLGGRDATVVTTGRPTTVKSRIVAHGVLVARVDREETAPLDEDSATALSAQAEQLVGVIDACVIADYGKGAVSPALCRTLLASGRARNVPVVVDPKGESVEHYRGATVVTPNARELFAATGATVGGMGRVEQAEHAAHSLVARLPGTTIVVTLDRDGMLVVGPDGTAHVRSQATAVIDPTGAGDAVAAAIAVALAIDPDRPTSEAVELAAQVAAVVVARHGTGPIDPGAIPDPAVPSGER